MLIAKLKCSLLEFLRSSQTAITSSRQQQQQRQTAPSGLDWGPQSSSLRGARTSCMTRRAGSTRGARSCATGSSDGSFWTSKRKRYIWKPHCELNIVWVCMYMYQCMYYCIQYIVNLVPFKSLDSTVLLDRVLTSTILHVPFILDELL